MELFERALIPQKMEAALGCVRRLTIGDPPKGKLYDPIEVIFGPTVTFHDFM